MQQVDRQAAKREEEISGMQGDNEQKVEQSPQKRSQVLTTIELLIKQKIGQLPQRRVQVLATIGLLVLLFAIINPLAAPAQGLRRPVVTHPKVKPTVVPTPTVPQRQIPVLTLHTTADSGDWMSYLGNLRRGDNTVENLIDATTASKLTFFWSAHAKGPVTSQPVVANGLIYWGSWDGMEHATDLNGHQVWATNLGTTTDYNCDPSSAGVASTPAVAFVTIHGTTTPVVFVGGGNAHFYALNALNGKVIWNVSLGDSPSYFIWSSPVVYRGSVYIGVSSFGDCPAIQGKLFQFNASTGATQNVFKVVPDGCIGGGIWSSPVVDTSTGELYVTTGSKDSCGTTEVLTTSMVELHASNLALVDYWQVPRVPRLYDSDFGASPTLFTATIGGVSRPLVGAAHKDGVFYAFIRGDIGAGPLWEDAVAYSGDCPNCGGGSISPAAWDGTRLYVAGGITYINGYYCPGSVRAINPANGDFIWERCLVDGAVLAPVTVAPGVVVVGEGPVFDIFNASNGKALFSYTDPSSYSLFWGAASISHGVLYIGNFDGNLYAFGIRQQPGRGRKQ